MRVRVAALLLVGLAAAACDAGDRDGPPPSLPGRPAPFPSPALTGPQVYVAVGASETVGIGASDPDRDAWPHVFLRTALPEGSELHLLGVPGTTTGAALEDQLPAALAIRPTIATVWLNVNDLNAGVPPEVYELQLGELVRQLRRDDTVVLVANTPRLERLPLYRACRDGDDERGLPCEFLGIHVPPAAELRALVAEYNEAIGRVAFEEGAILVDLFAEGHVAETNPDYLAPDGFHPSSAGARAVAERFAEALLRGISG